MGLISRVSSRTYRLKTQLGKHILKMVSQGNGRLSRPTTAGLPGPVRKIADPTLDFILEFVNFIYLFFSCLVNPTRTGTSNTQSDYNQRTRGGPGLGRNIKRFGKGSSMPAPTAGG